MARILSSIESLIEEWRCKCGNFGSCSTTFMLVDVSDAPMLAMRMIRGARRS